MSGYLDGHLTAGAQSRVRHHLAGCPDCRLFEDDMRGVIRWARGFPEYTPPDRLLDRILNRTPRVQRETWSDTLATMAGWIPLRRGPAAICASALCLVWLAGAVRITPASPGLESPEAIYYELDRLAGRVYDQAVRLYQRAPIVTEIQVRLDQIWENAG